MKKLFHLFTYLLVFVFAFFITDNVKAMDYAYNSCLYDDSCILLCNYLDTSVFYRYITIYYHFDGTWSVSYSNGYEKGDSSFYGSTKGPDVFSSVFSTSGDFNVFWTTGVSATNFTCPNYGYFDAQLFPELCFDDDGDACYQKSDKIYLITPTTLFGKANSGYYDGSVRKVGRDFEDELSYYFENWSVGDITVQDLIDGKYKTASDVVDKLETDFNTNFMRGNDIPLFMANTKAYTEAKKTVKAKFREKKAEWEAQVEQAQENDQITEEEAQEIIDNLETIDGNLEQTVGDLFNKIVETTVANGSASCTSLLGDPTDKDYLAYWIQWCLDLIKYAAILALLGFSTMDFFKAFVGDDKDAYKKAFVTTVKRFIFAVLIFFLPVIVEVIMKLFGAYGTCGIG